jgi:hypothetical protein
VDFDRTAVVVWNGPMTEPGHAPHEEPIAATQQFRRFVEEDLSAEVAQGRESRTRKMLLLIAAIVVIIAVVVVLAIVLS